MRGGKKYSEAFLGGTFLAESLKAWNITPINI